MASVDNKNDYSMEAGLLSTDREERTMSSKEALLQDSESAQAIPRTKTRRISPAGKALIALAACCLLGVGVASIGGATRFCPGHLRHGDVVGKHGMNAHRPNLSDSMAQMVRRQNTPAPTDTEQGTGPTDAASDGASNAPSGGSSGGASGGASNTVQQPTATNEASETAAQPSATAEESTDQASATDEASNTQAQPSVTQPSATSPPSATARPTEDSATEASPSATESQGEPTEPASTAASTQRTTRRTTENRPESTEDSSPESTTDDSEATATGDQETATQTDEASQTSDNAESATETKSDRSTVTGTGTRRTSSAVPKTFTSTLEDGGVTTMTSTSWVEVVPSAEATAGSNPDLQNAAPRSVGSVLAAVVGMVFGGFILL
ncbi:hypothetical protein FOCG_06828 [Fusarium oxysporum f. sp. radicis-lycopersici 26381]|uniref:Uncharacterized protein n=3 Tax=Fusarium oxysporum TaxID=5507 RepID=A0A0J9V444_FUSO4|nr:hypothetical protein FOXG_19545 [Fusarium oxysporum f. sp. lycopersici 4287]EWZ48258.1 hypothetical protein FOZG_03885 [Fusarium oxysporum Fo47]EWZ93330.1 hypothetical protein FOWG_06127 [Fusarium oxysporum f. sp. lycopersici MN25]EXK45590.1 hypothetical protein FOMG_03966 [Fusarium oxysporum f. sp. melonis 26406]EXL53592.1 hypothetical protein FOCG_06828 [Fusarium oxysporum f. sp. radicis-lycopersici 26381]EWZ48259.1 hypothetical protein FOZG_03885 [Fusarium oxysporum Fo47]